VRDNLQQSGLWAALRTRPFSKVPAVDATPASIFVTAIDTHPLAADPAVVIAEAAEDFTRGLRVLARLAKVFVCVGRQGAGQRSEQCAGRAVCRPASGRSAGYPHSFPRSGQCAQDGVAASVIRTSSPSASCSSPAACRSSASSRSAGPMVDKPRLVRTRLGANLDELTAGELKVGKPVRVISGSVFGGRTSRVAPAPGWGVTTSRCPAWKRAPSARCCITCAPGVEKHSVMNLYISKLNPGKLFNFTTSTNGSPRAMVPIGNYEEVMPLDILPTQLLRYLIVGDTDMAQKLGCLELDEEDLALCTYVCAGKYEYGPILRDNLTRIEKEG
jgi:Na+-transporting NADH:ubiquinone oxidoreductase subunit A